MTKTTCTRRNFLLQTTLAGAATTILPMLNGCATDPVTGRNQLVMMSEQEEISIDQQRSPYQFSADYGKVQDAQLNSYINRVGQELAQRSHRPSMPFSFRGVNAPYINAYAFPGGSIAATRGILLEMEDESELAGLLGHEIGHVCARHAAEQAGKGTLTQLLLVGASIATAAAGYNGAADLVQGIGAVGAGALLAGYSRDNEREADALGMQYMTRTGYSPQGMVKLMEILLKNGRKNPNAIELMFATHPMSSERLATVQQAANGQYQQMLGRAVNRERYMDNTAKLRRIKGAVTALQDGSKALKDKKYRDAENAFNQALRIAPNDYAALLMMAKLKLDQKQAKPAARYANKAIQVYPAEPQAHLVAGTADISLKRYGRAFEQLDKYDRLLPGSSNVVYYRGFCQDEMGRRSEAADLYTKYLSKVKSGEKAQYAYSRLKRWGYVK